jgi:hypothetical protein
MVGRIATGEIEDSETESSKDEAAVSRPQQSGQTGSTQTGGSPMLAFMKEFGVPLTRQNYLELALGLKPGERPTPEVEADIPSIFQKKV